MLLAHGADCIGAVGVLPVGGEIPLQPSRDGTLEDAAAISRKTLSGVQKKLLVYQDGRTYRPAITRDEPATHIAKFNQADELTLVQNEDLSLTLARELLGPGEVTRAHKGVVDQIEGIALLVERFDRIGTERLRLEDFAQVLDKPQRRDFDGKYDASYEEAAQAIVRHSARARIDLARFFQLICFNVLIGNADAHLKNFSLLESGEGLRLSPAYDLLCTLLYPFNNEAGLEIAGARRALESIDRAILLRFADGIGLPERAAQNGLDTLQRRLAVARTLEFGVPLEPRDFRARYKAVVTAQAERIFA